MSATGTITIDMTGSKDAAAAAIWALFDNLVDDMSIDNLRAALKTEARLRVRDEPVGVYLTIEEASALYSYVQGDHFEVDHIDTALPKLEPAYYETISYDEYESET